MPLPAGHSKVLLLFAQSKSSIPSSTRPKSAGQRRSIVYRELELAQMVLLRRDVYGILVGGRITGLDGREVFVVHGDTVEVNIVRPACWR